MHHLSLIRETKGAREFVAKAQQAGFSLIKEDFSGLYMTIEDCTLVLAVLPSRSPDAIWTLSIASKSSDTVCLIDEGRANF